MKFEWDREKAESNFRKHGIRFEEAVLVFNDTLAVSRQDRIVDGEELWQTTGLGGRYLLLVVAHAIRSEDGDIEVIRIISARPANKRERRLYEHGKI
jgi:uncharacterized DUF497 family protein